MHIEGDADSEDEKMEGFVVQAVKSMEDYDCGDKGPRPTFWSSPADIRGPAVCQTFIIISIYLF